MPSPRRAFWRTDSTWPSRTAAAKRARALRWLPTVIERQLVIRVVPVTRYVTGTGYAVEVGANRADLLRGPA